MIALQSSLPRKIQDGIFYDRTTEFKKHGYHSYAILFIRVSKDQDAQQVFNTLKKIWQLYEMLKKGMLDDIPNSIAPIGHISVLVAFGLEIFKIPNVKRIIPKDFNGKQFLPALAENPISMDAYELFSFQEIDVTVEKYNLF
jgi:hypothetical protein